MKQFNTPFIDDSEKMLDFLYLSKEDFLASYSYLTEEEYNATVDAVLLLLYPNDPQPEPEPAPTLRGVFLWRYKQCEKQ